MYEYKIRAEVIKVQPQHDSKGPWTVKEFSSFGSSHAWWRHQLPQWLLSPESWKDFTQLLSKTSLRIACFSEYSILFPRMNKERNEKFLSFAKKDGFLLLAVPHWVYLVWLSWENKRFGIYQFVPIKKKWLALLWCSILSRISSGLNYVLTEMHWYDRVLKWIPSMINKIISVRLL